MERTAVDLYIDAGKTPSACLVAFGPNAAAYTTGQSFQATGKGKSKGTGKRGGTRFR
jgi:hypothetical protein